MLNLKKTAVAVLALGSSTVFAGTMGTVPVCAPGNVSVPCEKNAWAFGVQALYLRHASQEYVSSTTVNDPNLGTVKTYDEYNQKWGWGFKLEGAYHHGTGNDINLNWSHYNKTSNGTITNNAAISIEPKWDAVNLEFGQHVDFAETKNIRFHAGAQYVRINNTLVNDVAGTIAHKLDGFGPRLGADMAADLGNGLSVYGNGATSIMIGNSKFSQVALDNNGDITGVNTGSKKQITPAVEAKLGVKYNYAMAQGDVALDVGYMWVNYFNALEDLNSSYDFALSGPYVGLKWVGNV